MALLALINEKTCKPGVNAIGDIVSIFDSGKVITGPQLELFDWVEVPETKSVVEMARPQIKTVFRAKSTEWSEERPEEKQVWDDGGDLKEIVIMPKYLQKYDGKAIVNTIPLKPENTVSTLIVKAVAFEVK